MKRIIALGLAIVLVMAAAVPALAITPGDEHNVGGTVVVVGGDPTANDPPVVKCKWETAAASPAADDDPLKPGLQVDPVVPQGTKTVYFWAVVTDENSLDQLQSVWAEIFHPADCTLKDQIELSPLLPYDATGWAQAQSMLNAADAAGLVTYGPGHDVSSTGTQLVKGEAILYRGELTFVHGQYGGY
jgi:hypothetical protein